MVLVRGEQLLTNGKSDFAVISLMLEACMPNDG